MTERERHCLDLVRQYDRDRYIASLFGPDDSRGHVLALYAFSVEVGRIPHMVTEPHIGEIRMQWWLDTLAAIARGDSQDHPVAQALLLAVREHALPIAPLENLVKAKVFDLYADPLPDLNELEGYLGETESALVQLAAMVLVGPQAAGVGEVSGLAGVAYGLAKLAGAAGRRTLIPPGNLDVKGQALKRLEEARSKQQCIPPAAFSAFLPCALTAQLVKTENRLSAWRRQWILWRAARAGRF